MKGRSSNSREPCAADAILVTLHGALDRVYKKPAADAFLLDQIGVP